MAHPHSHTILTLNTRQLNDDDGFLGTFLHEQFHWYAEETKPAVKATIACLHTIWPEVPVGPPDGAQRVQQLPAPKSLPLGIRCARYSCWARTSKQSHRATQPLPMDIPHRNETRHRHQETIAEAHARVAAPHLSEGTATPLHTAVREYLVT